MVVDFISQCCGIYFVDCTIVVDLFNFVFENVVFFSHFLNILFHPVETKSDDRKDRPGSFELGGVLVITGI